METTLRDQIALQFMDSILSSSRFNDYVDEPNIMESIANDAYLMADVMIKTRNKSK